MAIYNIKNLSFKYKNQTNFAVCNVNLELDEGGFYIICGASGSGKSTLLKLMKNQFSLIGDMTGEIYYNNQKIDDVDERVLVSDIGFLHQDIENGLVCDKVWKELSFGLSNLGFSDEYIGARVAEVSEYFGISKWYNRKISELSGGSKQIVSLAALMTMNPKVLLLDEPTSMLDPIAKKNFVSMTSRINKELGVTIVVVEHNMENFYDISNKIIVMDKGAMQFQETPLNLPKSLQNKSYAKYVGLTEFAQIYTALCGGDSMPVGVVEKRNWLKSVLKDCTKNPSKINTNLQNDEKKEIVLSAKNLYFRYDKKGADIVCNANFELNSGEIVCILGGNGGGKTTFINLLNGTLKAYSGKVIKDKTKAIATLPQNAKCLFVENTVKSEMFVTAKLLGIDKQIAEQLIKDFELTEIENSHPYDISGGEVERLALAKLFLTNPDIIILDEPTQGMDIKAKEYLKELLLQQKALGKSVIVVTHDLRFAADIADKVGLFFDGKVMAFKAAQEFFETNSLYTTESSLLTRDFVSGLYTADKIIDYIKIDK